jgi:hypothetical protein
MREEEEKASRYVFLFALVLSATAADINACRFAAIK